MLPSPSLRRLGVPLLLSLFVTATDAQWQPESEPELGPAPLYADAWLEAPDVVLEAPDLDLQAERLSRELLAKSLSVNRASRSSVATFFNGLYTPALYVPSGSTGSTATCTPGVTSQAYLDATMDMLNYFRVMTGLPVVTNDVGHNDEAQAAALMMQAAGLLTHYPPTDWPCYSSAGAMGASSSNLALGTSGPSSMVAYVRDNGRGNEPVGHRRWILYPPRLQMGPGSTSAANALWVFSTTGARPSSPAVVSWPPSGYVPYQVIYPRWSFSLNSAPGADYSNAEVTMSEGGVPIPLTVVSTFSGYGDNTIVWQPSGLSFGPGQADRTIHVTVTKIANAPGTATVSYDVVVMDPATVPTQIFDDGFEGASTSAWSSASQ